MKTSEMLCCLVVSKPQGLRILKCVQRELRSGIQVITFDDRDDVDRTAFDRIQNFCNDKDLDLLILNKMSLSRYLIDRKPDLCLISGWYWMIDLEALKSCRLGCLGVHNSLLPSFRGGAPLVWSIINGEKEVGASLFIMGGGMDDGPLVHQWRLSVLETEYMDGILARVEEAIASDIGVVINEYMLGIRKWYSQSPTGLSYAASRRKKDSEIDWNDFAECLFNQCRALQIPYPPLFFIKKGIEYRIRRMVKAPFKCYGTPGKVLAYVESGMLVSCGIGADGIILTDLVDAEGIKLVQDRPFPIGAMLASDDRN